MIKANDKIFTDREALKQFPPPKPTNTHNAIGHFRSVDQVGRLIVEAGHKLISERHEVTDDGMRCFSRFLVKSLRAEYQYFVGVRGCYDKLFARGVSKGKNVVVCSNLQFYGEYMITNKHTNVTDELFDTEIADNIRSMLTFKEIDQHVIKMKTTPVEPKLSETIIFECFRNKVLPASKFNELVDEWENPRHEAFKPRNLYSLENCFTEFMKDGRSSILNRSTLMLKSITDKYILN